MSMISLLKYQVVVGSNGSTWQTEWVRVDEGHQNWQCVVQVHSRIAGTTGTVQLQTTWDTSKADDIGSAQSVATDGIFPQDITTGMGPMVRLAFAFTADSSVLVSIWLTPKTD